MIKGLKKSYGWEREGRELKGGERFSRKIQRVGYSSLTREGFANVRRKRLKFNKFRKYILKTACKVASFSKNWGQTPSSGFWMMSSTKRDLRFAEERIERNFLQWTSCDSVFLINNVTWDLNPRQICRGGHRLRKLMSR